MDETKSKSQKKREADALQRLGTTLIEFNLERLDKLPLTETLRHAILQAKQLKSHGAIRRQAQLIGKLMRSADYEAIMVQYQLMCAEDSAQTQAFHELQQWRDKLIHDGKEALTDFVNAYHPHDLQKLRQLIMKAKEEQVQHLHSGANKALFRYLRDLIKST